MCIEVNFENGIAIVSLDREYLDSRNSIEFFKTLRNYKFYGKWVLIDLSQVEKINSCGISTLVLCQRWIKFMDKSLGFIGLQDQVKMTIKLIRLTNSFNLFNCKNDALEYVLDASEPYYSMAVSS